MALPSTTPWSGETLTFVAAPLIFDNGGLNQGRRWSHADDLSRHNRRLRLHRSCSWIEFIFLVPTNVKGHRIGQDKQKGRHDVGHNLFVPCTGVIHTFAVAVLFGHFDVGRVTWPSHRILGSVVAGILEFELICTNVSTDGTIRFVRLPSTHNAAHNWEGYHDSNKQKATKPRHDATLLLAVQRLMGNGIGCNNTTTNSNQKKHQPNYSKRRIGFFRSLVDGVVGFL